LYTQSDKLISKPVVRIARSSEIMSRNNNEHMG
jgi:hypothetical protein